MDNDNYQKLTKEQVEDFISWFNTVKGIHKYEYLTTELLTDIITNKVTTDKNGNFSYLSDESDPDEERLINKMLLNWDESNKRLANNSSDKARENTGARVNYLRDKFNIPEGYSNRFSNGNSPTDFFDKKPESSEIKKFKERLQSEQIRRKNISNSKKNNNSVRSDRKTDISVKESIIAARKNKQTNEESEIASQSSKVNDAIQEQTPHKQNEVTENTTDNKYTRHQESPSHLYNTRNRLTTQEDEEISEKLDYLEHKLDQIEKLRRENKYLEQLCNQIKKDRSDEENFDKNSSVRRPNIKFPPNYRQEYFTPIAPKYHNPMHSDASFQLLNRPPNSYQRPHHYPPHFDNPDLNNYYNSGIYSQPPQPPPPIIPVIPYKSAFKNYRAVPMMKPYPDYDYLESNVNSPRNIDKYSGDYTTSIVDKYLSNKNDDEYYSGKYKIPTNFIKPNKKESNPLYKKEDSIPNKEDLELPTNTLSSTQQNIINDIKESLDIEYEKIDNEVYKKIEDGYTSEEYNYFLGLSEEDKHYFMFIENSVKTQNKTDVPLRFKVLEKDINLENKSIIVKKIDENNKNKFSLGSENTKFNNWLTGLLKIPFGVYRNLPITKNNSTQEICDYLVKSKKHLDNAVYGHTTTKNQIIQLITQWISNPSAGGNVIGIQGPMGNGKTTLVKNGVSKAVDRPFAFVTLGGCSDSSFLEGHNYTYEGSMWGRIVDILIQSKCMNPIIYFDELDKVSQTKRGDEIINMLIHLTDSSQNQHFQDKYFSGIDIDISKCIFIFSYNDASKINPILLDRLLTIETDGFEKEDKIKIANEYLISEITTQLGMEKGSIDISDEVIGHLIEKFTSSEKGVRGLKRNLEIIFSKINVILLTQGTDEFSYDIEIDKNEDGNVVISKETAEQLIKEFHKNDSEKEMEFAMYC
jgi:hypothetical protein